MIYFLNEVIPLFIGYIYLFNLPYSFRQGIPNAQKQIVNIIKVPRHA